MQVTWVADTTTTLVQVAPPRVTVAPVRKFVPVRVRVSPPSGRPVSGDTEVTVGGPNRVVRETNAVFVPHTAVMTVPSLETIGNGAIKS